MIHPALEHPTKSFRELEEEAAEALTRLEESKARAREIDAELEHMEAAALKTSLARK